MRWGFVMHITGPKEFAQCTKNINPLINWSNLCRSRDKSIVRYFDWSEFKVAGFINYLNALANLSGDEKFYFYDLDPAAPVDEFYRLFKKYPVVKLDIGVNEKEYFSTLREEPGKVPGRTYAVDTTNRYAIFPESMNWYIYGEYDIELAVLMSKVGLPPDELFPHTFFTEKEVERLIALKER